jgi:O-antigen ligase
MEHVQVRGGRAAWIQRGLILLVAVMPFHAFLSVWLGHMFGHQAAWQSWKEVLLLVLLAASSWQFYRKPELWRRLRTPLIYVTIGFIAVGLLVTLVARPGLTPAIYGIKTDMEFLVAMMVTMMVAQADFTARLARVIIATSAGVIGFGLLQIYALPADWLRHFGYGPTTIQPYQLVDPAVRSIRILSTLGGPNQLGSFLILPLCLVGWRLLTRPRWWQALYVLAGLIVVWHSYSRSAWLGLGVAAIVLIALRLPRRWRLPALLFATLLAAVTLSVVTTLSGRDRNLQYYLFHQTLQSTGISASTSQHISSYQNGIREARTHLLGEGLGSAGPASFHGSRPLIPEDYYLQLAIETGIAGLVLFVATEVLLALRLVRAGSTSGAAPALLAALAGISVINFALHGWADSSTALVFWTLAGAAVGTT